MNTGYSFKLNTLAILILAACGLVFGPRTSAGDEGAGVEVLTRGPVHEAFAQTVTFDPEPTYEIRKAPPEMIEEMPPEVSMDGDNVAWIPGYWAWDEDGGDFIWVSGIWRDLPPGRQWVPGYWSEERSGYRWISGYWADANVSETRYLPRPPRTLEAGPNIAAPSRDYTWVPGCWVWDYNRYAWRPGYWAPCRTDWIWIPAYYVCAPRGYVYVEGYWDYGIHRRGVLFAPVHFDLGLRVASYHYAPSVVIDMSFIVDCLFVRPRYCHYYFGDYFDPVYVNVGFYPCFSYYSERRGYDPIYAYRRWEHRDVVDWEVHIEADYRRRRDHAEARPPRTYAKAREFYAQGGDSEKRAVAIAATLNEVAERKDHPVRFKNLDNDERQKFGQRGKEVRQFRDERKKLEAQAVEPGKSFESLAKNRKVTKVPFSKSPIMGKPAGEFGKDREPPKSPDVPKFDDSARPRSKRTEGRGDRTSEKLAPDADDSRGGGREERENRGKSDDRSGSKGRDSDTRGPDRKSDQPAGDSKPAPKSDAGEKKSKDEAVRVPGGSFRDTSKGREQQGSSKDKPSDDRSESKGRDSDTRSPDRKSDQPAGDSKPASKSDAGEKKSKDEAVRVPGGSFRDTSEGNERQGGSKSEQKERSAQGSSKDKPSDDRSGSKGRDSDTRSPDRKSDQPAGDSKPAPKSDAGEKKSKDEAVRVPGGSYRDTSKGHEQQGGSKSGRTERSGRSSSKDKPYEGSGGGSGKSKHK